MSWFTGLIWLLSLVAAGTSVPLVCHPTVTGVRFDGAVKWSVSARISQMYSADQLARHPEKMMDLEAMQALDRQHREEAMRYLQAGEVQGAEALYQTALLFQHGDCPDHYRLAADLASRAAAQGHQTAGWLSAAATDRLLLSERQMQRYGTQYAPDLQSRFHLCPVSTVASDADRAALGLPPLADLITREAEITAFSRVPAHPLAFLAAIPGIGNVLNQAAVFSGCLN